MPVLLAKTIPTILINLGASLLTERFLKHLIVLCLEKLVKRTKTDMDDKLLEEAKKEWGMGE